VEKADLRFQRPDWGVESLIASHDPTRNLFFSLRSGFETILTTQQDCPKPPRRKQPLSEFGKKSIFGAGMRRRGSSLRRTAIAAEEVST